MSETRTTETRDRDDAVDRLLHDAEHADGGAEFARNFVNDDAAARRLRLKRDRLIVEAHGRDPEHAAPAWAETSLSPELIAAALATPTPEPAHD